MNVFKKLICCVCLLLLTVSAFAKTGKKDEPAENRDAYGKLVRGPYIANKLFDNWIVGLDGGTNIFMHKKGGYSGLPAAYIGLYGGKWIDPVVGFRLGLTGIQGRQNAAASIGSSEPQIASFMFMYAHADVMINITNSIWGYKEKRLWNAIPYAHVGALGIFSVNDPTMAIKNQGAYIVHVADAEVGFGLGLYNTIRITKILHATIDLRHLMFSGRYHSWDGGGIASDLSISAGLVANLGKVGWDRGAVKSSLVEARAARDAAEVALENSRKAYRELEAKNKDLLEAIAVIREYANTEEAAASTLHIFFDMNQTAIPYTEIKHLKYYAATVMREDPTQVFYITGATDLSTGSLERNMKLSQDRVNNTVKYLTEKCGIDPSRLVVKEVVAGESFGSDPEFNRAVRIEH